MFITRSVRITRRVRVWNYFFTRIWVRVTQRVKFCECGYGYGYGWTLPIKYVPVAIFTWTHLKGYGVCKEQVFVCHSPRTDVHGPRTDAHG
jgi:hypothetical protein